MAKKLDQKSKAKKLHGKVWLKSMAEKHCKKIDLKGSDEV